MTQQTLTSPEQLLQELLEKSPEAQEWFAKALFAPAIRIHNSGMQDPAETPTITVSSLTDALGLVRQLLDSKVTLVRQEIPRVHEVSYEMEVDDEDLVWSCITVGLQTLYFFEIVN